VTNPVVIGTVASFTTGGGGWRWVDAPYNNYEVTSITKDPHRLDWYCIKLLSPAGLAFEEYRHAGTHLALIDSPFDGL
jgi:hypothetical protein